jgi:hypothetical protein
VGGNPKLVPAHPELQEPGVEVYERSAPEHGQAPRRNVVREVEQEIRLRSGVVEIGPAPYEPGVELVVGEVGDGERPAEPVGLEPGIQGGDVALDLRPRPGFYEFADVLEPDDAAVERSQRQRPVEIHPEMAAALGIGERVE